LFGINSEGALFIFFFELSFSRLICDDYLHFLLVDLSFKSKVTFWLFSYVDISIDKYLSFGDLYQALSNCQKMLQYHVGGGADPKAMVTKKLTETNSMNFH
jgi:hypothetical protein